MENVEKRLPRATVQKGKIAYGNLASLHGENYKLLQREKTVEKLLTSDIIEPERKEEYNLDDEWTDAICEKLKEYERIDKND